MDLAPTHDSAANEAFRRAVELAGGQVKIAELVGKTQSAVSKRLAAGKPLWAEDVLTVEAATGVSRHQLRPDLYPIESAGPSADDGAPNAAASHLRDPDGKGSCERSAVLHSAGGRR